MKKISVIIITFNEEKNIRRCLESVLWADEIIVVDSMSTDLTREICAEYKCKVMIRKFTDFSDMKNFALSVSSNEWVLSIDADEEVAENLRLEIDKQLRDADPSGQISGFYIKRRSSIFGKWFRFSGTQDDYQMRLFKKSRVKYYQPIHEKLSIDGKTGCIKEPFLHYTYESIYDHLARMNKYTDMEADFLKKQKTEPSMKDITIRPILRFVQLYVFRSGFRDGVPGFAFCFLSGVYDFVKFCKLWEKTEQQNSELNMDTRRM